ncbi:MAG: tRNA pseudouridine(13) synthase TruD [Clostridiales Family XIII bacterium]|jgi:hypothetical protein|nr:tRNA pseudouridine(13) synthase TruD [Clostridiales Family XIII bacterium]
MNKYLIYEAEKRKIAEKKPTPEEYQRLVRELARRLGI